jgi:hypothetical protein
MDADVPPDANGKTRAGIDAIETRLVPAPDSQAGRKSAPYRSGNGKSPVSEEVAAADSDDAPLSVTVEEQVPAERLLVDPTLREQGEGG